MPKPDRPTRTLHLFGRLVVLRCDQCLDAVLGRIIYCCCCMLTGPAWVMCLWKDRLYCRFIRSAQDGVAWWSMGRGHAIICRHFLEHIHHHWQGGLAALKLLLLLCCHFIRQCSVTVATSDILSALRTCRRQFQATSESVIREKPNQTLPHIL